MLRGLQPQAIAPGPSREAGASSVAHRGAGRCHAAPLPISVYLSNPATRCVTCYLSHRAAKRPSAPVLTHTFRDAAIRVSNTTQVSDARGEPTSLSFIRQAKSRTSLLMRERMCGAPALMKVPGWARKEEVVAPTRLRMVLPGKEPKLSRSYIFVHAFSAHS